jgi:hypothetical protein
MYIAALNGYREHIWFQRPRSRAADLNQTVEDIPFGFNPASRFEEISEIYQNTPNAPILTLPAKSNNKYRTIDIDLDIWQYINYTFNIPCILASEGNTGVAIKCFPIPVLVSRNILGDTSPKAASFFSLFDKMGLSPTWVIGENQDESHIKRGYCVAELRIYLKDE